MIFLREYNFSTNFFKTLHTGGLPDLHNIIVDCLHAARALEELGDLTALQKIIFQNWACPERNIQVSDHEQKNVIKFIQSNVLEALENM